VGRIFAGSGTWVRWNPDASGTDVSETTTLDLIERLFASATVTGIDTASNYGYGESERRIGEAIRRAGGIPDDFRIQTKADRDMSTGDFSGAQVRRSLDASRRRLGLDVLPVVYLHDPENMGWDDAHAVDGPVAALLEARQKGRIAMLGVAGAPSALLARYLRTGDFESVITHNRYTIVDRSSDRLLDLAASLRIEAINASPYGGGFLTAWPPPTTRYAYGEASDSVRRSAEIAARLCASHGIPLAAAALAFSLREPRISATIVGMQDAGDLAATEELAAVAVPPEAMSALMNLNLDPSGWQDPTDDQQL
jgi:D-threo-aldose 1-dehydrogenase